MAYIMALNKIHAIQKAKLMAKRITGNQVNVKVIGKPNPKYTHGKYRMYYVSIQKKNKA